MGWKTNTLGVVTLSMMLAACSQENNENTMSASAPPAAATTTDDIFTGTYLEGSKAFHMTAASNGMDYTIRVSLPPKYKNSGNNHPLLIVNDGSMLFATAAESAGIQASTGETHPVIVVGVSAKGTMQWHNTRRQYDYSGGTALSKVMLELLEQGPITSEMGGLWPLYNRLQSAGIAPEDGFGGAAKYLEFLTEELLPRLQAQYRVDPEEIGLMGHSMGGAFVGHTLLTKTSPFSKFIAGTFSMDAWYTPEEMAAMQATYAATAAPRKVDVFHGYGGVELLDFPGAVEGAMAFLEALKVTDPGHIDSMLHWNFEREQHGSVTAAVVASGIHHHWGTGLSYSEAAKQRNNDEWQ